MMKETFAAARARLLTELRTLGWAVSSGLKVEHARNPEGTMALFFRAQAVYFAPLSGNQSAASAAKDSRSICSDIRGYSASMLINIAIRYEAAS